MIVIVKMKTGETRKAFIRNQIFHEVDKTNKKVDSLTTSKINSVCWPEKLHDGFFKIEDVPIKKWLEMAEENEYWGLT